MTLEPSPEQFEEWLRFAVKDGVVGKVGIVASHVARLAYQAGADAELEECCAWLSGCDCPSYGKELRAARRPKPPSLKEQALRELDGLVDYIRITQGYEPADPNIIRQALKALPED